MSFHDDILVYGGDKLAKRTNGKEFREYRAIKMDNGIILKLASHYSPSFHSFLVLLSPYNLTELSEWTIEWT